MQIEEILVRAEELGRTYVGSPFSHESLIVRSTRYRTIVDVSRQLLKAGVKIFSPVIHYQPIVEPWNIPSGSLFWKRQINLFLKHWAETLLVIQMDGWRESVGLSYEIKRAKILNLRIFYMEVPRS